VTLDTPAAARFQAGAGLDPGVLREAVLLLVALAVILWAATTVQHLGRRWRDGGTDLFGVLAGMLAATVLAGLLLYILN
jgi:hypothetical protein